MRELTILGKSQLATYHGVMESEIGARVRSRLKALSPPVTQADMAARLDLTPDAFSRSLSGKRAFTAVELVKLAEELGTSAHWFVTGEPDPFAVTFAGRHAYDPLVKSYVSVDWASSRQARDDIALAYIQAFGSVPAVPRESHDWTAATARARLVEVAGESFVRKLADAVELAFAIDVIRLDDIDPDFALSVIKRDVIVIDASAYWFRENFSIAHELAHILLGHLETLGAAACADKSAEKAANTFAAELLLPAQTFTQLAWQSMSTVEVAHFVWTAGVSTASVQARVSALRVAPGPEAVKALSMKTQVLVQKELPHLVDEISARMSEASQRRFPEHLITAHSHGVSEGLLLPDTLAWMLHEPAELIRDELAPAPLPVDIDWLASELGFDE